MPNAYDTPAYRAYIANHAVDASWTLVDEEIETFTMHARPATRITRTWERQTDTSRQSLETGRLILQDANGAAHTFDTVDRVFPPVPLTLRNRNCVLFCRTLYGYTLLDVADMAHPLRDYFPSAVLAGEESFIVCSALPLDDLIVLEGCYWACARNDVFILAPSTGLTLHLNAVAEMEDVVEHSVSATSHTLTLREIGAGDRYDRESPSAGTLRTFTLDQIREMLEKHGQTDL